MAAITSAVVWPKNVLASAAEVLGAFEMTHSRTVARKIELVTFRPVDGPNERLVGRPDRHGPGNEPLYRAVFAEVIEVV